MLRGSLQRAAKQALGAVRSSAHTGFAAGSAASKAAASSGSLAKCAGSSGLAGPAGNALRAWRQESSRVVGGFSFASSAVPMAKVGAAPPMKPAAMSNQVRAASSSSDACVDGAEDDGAVGSGGSHSHACSVGEGDDEDPISLLRHYSDSGGSLLGRSHSSSSLSGSSSSSSSSPSFQVRGYAQQAEGGFDRGERGGYRGGDRGDRVSSGGFRGGDRGDRGDRGERGERGPFNRGERRERGPPDAATVAANAAARASADQLEVIVSAKESFLSKSEDALPIAPGLREVLYRYNWDRLLVDVRRQVDMRKGRGRQEMYTAMVAVGNMQGLFGLGLGTAVTAQQAVANAHMDAYSNLSVVPLYRHHTVFHHVCHTFHHMKIKMMPRPEGFGLVASDLIVELCRLIGIRNLSVKLFGRRQNKLYVAQCFAEALQKQTTPYEGVEGTGVYVREVLTHNGVPIANGQLPMGLQRGVHVP